MAKKNSAPPRTDFDLGDLLAAGYQAPQQAQADDANLVGPETQRVMDGKPARDRGFGGAVKDTAVQLAEGANSIIGAIPSLVSPDSRVAKFFDKNADYWRDLQSDDIKARMQAASDSIDKVGEDGVIAQVVEAAHQYTKDPSLAARFVVTNLPSVIPGIGAAKVAQAASLAKSARAAGVASEALSLGAKAKAAAAATTVSGLVNAGLNAGGARGDAYNEVKQAALKAGMSENDANELALQKSLMPAAVGGIAGFISGKTGLEHSLFGAGTAKSAKKAAIASMVGEMAGEQLEEVAPQLATNYQASDIDSRSLTKGIGRTMVETAIGAGPSTLMGGVAEGVNARKEHNQQVIASAQNSGGIVSRAGLAANGHDATTATPEAPIAPATAAAVATPATQAAASPAAPSAQPKQDMPPAPVILARQEIAAMRSAPDLDEAESRRLQFLEENLGDPQTLAELYGMEYNPPPEAITTPATPKAQPAPAKAPAQPAGVSTSGAETVAASHVDQDTGEILPEQPSAGEPPQAPLFDERGQVVPEHDPFTGRSDEDLRTQRLNALSTKVRQSISEELQRRGAANDQDGGVQAESSGDHGVMAVAPSAVDVSETAPWRRNIGKAKKLADQLGISHQGMKLPALAEAIERATGNRNADVASDISGGKLSDEWTAFSDQSGTLGIPRAEMPQIKAEHRGAMVNFLKGKGIEATPETIPARAIKPTQAEFSPEKVKSAMEYTGGDRAILVSADGHVVDGHHQWLAKREKGEPIKALRLDAGIRDVLDALKDMPSAQPDTGEQSSAPEPTPALRASSPDDAIDMLAEILRKDGWGEFREKRQEIADQFGLNANETLGLGTKVQAKVGAQVWDNARAHFDPYRSGRVAQMRGEPPIPPMHLSNEQQGQWMEGWDSGKPDDDNQSTAQDHVPGEVVGEATEVTDAPSLPEPELTPEQITEKAKALLSTVRRFASGLSNVGDLGRGTRASGGAHLSGVGVDVGLLSKNALEVIGNAVVNQHASVFVDSGAFSAFRRGLKSGEFTPMDFDSILAKYDAITDVISRHADEAGEQNDYPRPLFVMPDVVGNQAESLALIQDHRDWIAGEVTGNLAKAIVPIQTGDVSMADAYRRVVDMLGTDDFIVGIPSNEKAVSPDELKEFLADAKPKAIHILGAASDVKLQPRLESIVAAGLDGHIQITADASPIRNKVIRAVAKGAKRGDVIESLLHDKNDPGIAPYYQPEPAEETNGTEAPETIQTEAQGQEEPAGADAVSAPPQVDTSPGAKWRKNWAEAKNTAESLGLPTKDGKRNLKLTELVPAIEAKLKDGAEGHAVAMLPADPEVFESALGSLFAEADQVRGEDERFAATFRPDIKPVSLPRVTSAKPKPDGVEFMTPDAAAKVLQSWKDEVDRQDREKHSANNNRTVISLFDASGVMSQPWIDAGYNVVTYDIQTGDDINDFNAEMLLDRHGNDNVWAVIAQPPCTDYASSGSQWWANKDKEGLTELSNELVRQTMRTIELFRPPVWWLENPVGRIQKLNNLPDPLLSFDPWHFGDPWTKRTNYWGNFNPRLPTAMVEPVEGSKIHKLSSSAKYERSLTPEGVAYAMFMANNAEGMSAGERMSKEFPGVPRELFDAALESGRTEQDIRENIEDAYYDSDLEYVREELAKGLKVLPVNLTKIIGDVVDKQVERAKSRAMRLRAQAKASDLTLEQKLEKQDGVKKADEALRKMRQNVFAAHDAAMEAVSGKDAGKFSEYKTLFPDVYSELVQFFGEPAQVEAPAEPEILDATNMTPMAVHEALMNGAKLSRHGETVWVGRKTTGTVDSYVVHSKEDDGSTVFTKGPVGASRDIGWSRGEAAEKAVASWDFDTVPVLEAQVAEQDAMLNEVLDRLAKQGMVTDGRLEQRRVEIEAMLDKTRERIRAKKAQEPEAQAPVGLESIFSGLQQDGQARAEAEQLAAQSPMADQIQRVEANFHDALLAMMEAGTLTVNGHSAITEDNRACL